MKPNVESSDEKMEIAVEDGPRVYVALNRLCRRMEELRTKINMLETRLGPVIREEEKACDETLNKSEKLWDTLESLHRQAGLAIGDIDSIDDRLEL